MRVAAVCGFPPNRQGEANYSAHAYSALARHYPDVTIRAFAHREAGVPDVADLMPNLSVERVTGGATRAQRTSGAFSLIRAVLAFRPNVVHLQGTHTPLYGGFFGEPMIALLGALRARGISSVVTTHSVWMPAELDDLWRAKRLPGPAARAGTYYYGAYLRAMASRADVWRICVAGDASPSVAEYVAEYHLRPRRLVAEPHGCAVSPVSAGCRETAKHRLGLAGRRVLLTTGYVRPDKSAHLLLEAASQLLARHSDVVIAIAGEPVGAEGVAYAEQLRAMARRLAEDDRIRLDFRYLPEIELQAYLDAADVVVVPYTHAMGPSGPVHHALSKGKAVVASNVGHNRGLRGVVKLFEPVTSEGLADSLEDLLADPSSIDEYGRWAIAYARDHSWDKLAASYLTDYRALTEAWAPREPNEGVGEAAR